MRLRRILVVMAALLLILSAAYFGGQAWIESAGGRQAIEDQLGQASGMQVRITGELDVFMLPVPGVRGSGLEISDPESGERLAQGRDFEAELSPRALVDRRLRVDRLELSWLTLGPEGGRRFSVPRVALSGFEPGSVSQFEIDLGPFGAVDGEFTWRPGVSRVDLDMSGELASAGAVTLAGQFVYSATGAVFNGLELEMAGQQLRGSGCYRAGGIPVLNLDMAADRLDLDALQALWPGGSQGTGRLPLDVNLRLRASEMVSGDVTARDALFEYGSAIECP